MKKIILAAILCILPVMARSQAKLTWGNCDTRCLPAPQTAPVPVNYVSGWKGERVNLQLIVTCTGEDEDFSYAFSDLKGPQGAMIYSGRISGGFVKSVLSDEFSGCGMHDVEAHGRYPVADRISSETPVNIAGGESLGLWLTVWIPSDARPGRYTGYVSVNAGGRIFKSRYTVNVIDRTLPDPSEWKFHLDLWQNPYAVARVHNLKPWSEEHFDALRPYMTKLARAGQKAVTATLINRPWDGQTYDPFGSMVTWVRKIDGSWWYDFSIFDKWVDFMAECGISEEITCFSMLPWSMSFRYFDQATGENADLRCEASSKEYEEFWGGMLKEFEEHLKTRGLLGKTFISMDEREPEQMAAAIGIIRRYAPGIKISLAGNYHPEIESDIFDYCLRLRDAWNFTPEMVARRRSEGKVSTYYVCCGEKHPNVFTFSEPADAEFIPVLALKLGLDGFLRWAYNSWTEDAENDARFISWPAGDTHIVYPFSQSSIRWERLVEGIQDFEKFNILMDEAMGNGDEPMLSRLESLLSEINTSWFEDGSCSGMIQDFKRGLNSFK